VSQIWAQPWDFPSGLTWKMATLRRDFFRLKARSETAPQALTVLPTAFQPKFGERQGGKAMLATKKDAAMPRLCWNYLVM